MIKKSQIILSLVIIVLTINLVSASDYILLCMRNGETVRFSLCNPQIADKTCTSSSCQMCASIAPNGAYCPAALGFCGNPLPACTYLSNNSTNQTTPPFVITLVNPPNGFFTTNPTVTFSYSLTNSAKAKKCELLLNGNSVATNSTKINSSVNTITRTLTPNLYAWQIKCTNSTNQFSLSEIRNLFIQSNTSNSTNSSTPSPPVISLISPANNYNTINSEIQFLYSVTNPQNVSSCSLYLNDNLTSSNSTAIVSTNTFLQNLSVGNYSWFVNCTNNNGLSGSSAKRNLFVLSSSNQSSQNITITLISPSNNYNTTTNTSFKAISFFYRLSNVSSITSCNLVLNSNIAATNTYNSNSATTASFNNIQLAPNTYIWNVNCLDLYNFNYQSESRTLRIFGNSNTNSTTPGNQTNSTTPTNQTNSTIPTNSTTNSTEQNSSTQEPVIQNPPSSSRGGGGGGGSSCSTQWNCTSWSVCANGEQTRTCSYPKNKCKPTSIKPAEKQTCIEQEIVNLNTNNNEKSEQTAEDAEQVEQTSSIEKTSLSNKISGYSIFLKDEVSKNKEIAFAIAGVIAGVLSLFVVNKNKVSKKSRKRKFK